MVASQSTQEKRTLRHRYYKDNVYACKALRKAAIVQMQQTHHVMNEKKCLQAQLWMQHAAGRGQHAT